MKIDSLRIRIYHPWHFHRLLEVFMIFINLWEIESFRSHETKIIKGPLFKNKKR